jgi:hypothetical protein
MRGESDSESSKTFVLDQSLSAEGATAPGNSQAPWTLHRKNSGEKATLSASPKVLTLSGSRTEGGNTFN